MESQIQFMENLTLPLPDEPLIVGVSDAIALINQTLEYAYPTLVVEGEVASYKVNQGKFVFFDIKDAGGTLGCFMMLFNVRVPLEDGMRVRVVANPKITQWGKFSLTVRSVQPVGEGALKRSFELLKAKLASEGLFAPERKRMLAALPEHIAVISSTQAAGYADFVKILNDRWGGLNVEVAHTQVQGVDAPAQIVRAIEYFNQREELPEVIVIIRGGGSADDLAAFNDEPLVRAIAASRVPVLTGIGHEVDVSLSDMAADVRAATPSNAAQLLVPDRREIIIGVDRLERQWADYVVSRYQEIKAYAEEAPATMSRLVHESYSDTAKQLERMQTILGHLDPRQALNRGFAIARSAGKVIRSGKDVKAGDELSIELKDAIMKVGVQDVESKN